MRVRACVCACFCLSESSCFCDPLSLPLSYLIHALHRGSAFFLILAARVNVCVFMYRVIRKKVLHNREEKMQEKNEDDLAER